jgi:hypothetical protein
MRTLPTAFALLPAIMLVLTSMGAQALEPTSSVLGLAALNSEAPMVQKVGSAAKACKSSAKSAGLRGKELRRSVKACKHKDEQPVGNSAGDEKRAAKQECKRRGKVAGLRGDAFRQSVRACMGKPI